MHKQVPSFCKTEREFTPVIPVSLNTVGHIDEAKLASFLSHTICTHAHSLVDTHTRTQRHKSLLLAALLIKYNLS